MLFFILLLFCLTFFWEQHYDDEAHVRREAYNTAVKDYRSRPSPVMPTPTSSFSQPNLGPSLQSDGQGIYLPYSMQQNDQQQQLQQRAVKRFRPDGYHIEHDEQPEE